MRHIFATMKQNLQNIRKSPKVADETMFAGGNIAELPIYMDRARQGRRGFSIICSIVRAPLSLLSCLAHPHINGADGVWVSGELTRVSEMNHIMVSDSMRYAILM